MTVQQDAAPAPDLRLTAGIYAALQARDPAQLEFHQTAREVLESLDPMRARHPEYVRHRILERLCEPERQLVFRVFLGFEQIFKNALTGLPIGGGKGGAYFDPRGRSDSEIMRFWQSFMTVASRPVQAHHQPLRVRVLTGKGLAWGGSHVRTEATGYGTVTEDAPTRRESRRDVRLRRLCRRQGGHRRRLVKEFWARYVEGGSVWDVPCSVTLPCATQNELDGKAARTLLAGGVVAVAEGANMPTTPQAVRLLQEAGVAFGPGKAANAGGVATSALEMRQNATRDAWSFEDTDRRLAAIMAGIPTACLATAQEYGAHERPEPPIGTR